MRLLGFISALPEKTAATHVKMSHPGALLPRLSQHRILYASAQIERGFCFLGGCLQKMTLELMAEKKKKKGGLFFFLFFAVLKEGMEEGGGSC